MRILSFDLETTGLRVDADRIVQYSFVLLDQDLVERGRWGGVVNPGIPIPPESTAIHGLTDSDVRDAQPFASIAPALRELVTPDTVMSGHNAYKFDVPLLHHEFLRSGVKGIPVTQPVIDTLRLEQRVNSHRLTDTYRRYHGSDFKGAHGAPGDNDAHVAVLRKQREVHANVLPASLQDLVVREEEPPLDWGGYFFRDKAGVVRFGFGKHRGEAALDRPDYLDWMVRSDFPQDAKDVARQARRAR